MREWFENTYRIYIVCIGITLAGVVGKMITGQTGYLLLGIFLVAWILTDINLLLSRQHTWQEAEDREKYIQERLQKKEEWEKQQEALKRSTR